MFVGGFHEAVSSDDAPILKFNVWEEAGRTIGFLAKHFTQSGKSVDIHDHVNELLIAQIESIAPIAHKVLLYSSITSVIASDKGRGAHMTMGETMVRDHHTYFAEAQFEDFVTIDSTHDEVGQTVSKMSSLVER